MKFDEIVNVHGKTPKRMTASRLYQLGNDLFKPYDWKFIEKYESETSTSLSGRRCRVTIGNKALYENCGNSECNKAAYVLMVKDMYHEWRHVWQNTTAWNDSRHLESVKSYRMTTDLVRREFVKGYFPSAYYNNYSNDPGEMDAEAYGIRQALAYFRSDPVIGSKEAEGILFQLMVSDDCVHREMLDTHRDSLGSIYDVLGLFEKQADEAVDIKYPVTDSISPAFMDGPDMDLSLTREFLYSRTFSEYRKAFGICSTGREQDKVLEQAILLACPGVLREPPPRLKKELLECRQQMELGSLRPGLHAVPPGKINYSFQALSEDITLTAYDIDQVSASEGMYL